MMSKSAFFNINISTLISKFSHDNISRAKFAFPHVMNFDLTSDKKELNWKKEYLFPEFDYTTMYKSPYNDIVNKVYILRLCINF